MKYLKTILPLIFVLNFSFAQNRREISASGSDLESLINSRRFEFAARSASPLSGRTIYLTPGYNLVVSPDTISSDLPYYGRAYQAPMNPGDAGIKFTSADFSYAMKKKRTSWTIIIKPTDVNNSPQIYLTISTKNSASLRISSSDKQSVSFEGMVKPVGN